MAAFFTASPIFVLLLSTIIENEFLTMILFIISVCLSGIIEFHSDDPKTNPSGGLFILCFLGSLCILVRSRGFNEDAAFVLYTSVIAIAESMKKMKK